MDTRLDLERGLIAAENDLYDTLHDLEHVTAERDALLQLIADLRTANIMPVLRGLVCYCPSWSFRRPNDGPGVSWLRRQLDPDWHDETCVWRRLMQTEAP